MNSSMQLRYFGLLVTLVSPFLFVSCNQGSDGTVTIKLAHNGNEQHPFQDGYNAFAQALAAATDGKVDVQIFPNSQLGSEEEANEMVERGTIAGNAASAAGIAPTVKEVDLLNFPFIFNDLDHFYRVLDGPIGVRLAKQIEEDLDCVVLAWWFSGIRNVWNSTRPVTVPGDLDGLKIRVIASPIVRESFDALGALPSTMSFGELYSAVQTGVLDGAESDHTDLLVEKFYEVTEYVSMTEHLYLAAAFIFSKKQFDKLTPEMQQAVRDAGAATAQIQRKAMESKNESSLAELKELGIKFNDVEDDKFRALIKEANIYENNADHVGSMTMITELIKQ